MGFSESLAVDALRMFNNSKDEAVWTVIYSHFDTDVHICSVTGYCIELFP